jgi:hypothetical protein
MALPAVIYRFCPVLSLVFQAIVSASFFVLTASRPADKLKSLD